MILFDTEREENVFDVITRWNDDIIFIFQWNAKYQHNRAKDCSSYVNVKCFLTEVKIPTNTFMFFGTARMDV